MCAIQDELAKRTSTSLWALVHHLPHAMCWSHERCKTCFHHVMPACLPSPCLSLASPLPFPPLPSLLSHNMPTISVLPAFRDLTPHPQYAAFYKWLQQDFQADAVVHFGMHGTVEWLPGAPLGEAPPPPSPSHPSHRPHTPHATHTQPVPPLLLEKTSLPSAPPYIPKHLYSSPSPHPPHLPTPHKTPLPPCTHSPYEAVSKHRCCQAHSKSHGTPLLPLV